MASFASALSATSASASSFVSTKPPRPLSSACHVGNVQFNLKSTRANLVSRGPGASAPRAQFVEDDGKKARRHLHDAATDLSKATDDVSNQAQSAGQSTRAKTDQWVRDRQGDTKEVAGETRDWLQGKGEEAGDIGRQVARDTEQYLGEKAEVAKEEGTDVLKQAATAVLTFAENVLGGAEEKSQAAGEEMKGVWEDTTAKLGEVSEDVASKGGDVINDVSSSTDKALGKVQGSAEEAWEGAKDVSADAPDSIGGATGEGGWKSEIRESPEEVTNEFGDAIENKFGDMFGTPEQCIDEIQKEMVDSSKGGEVPASKGVQGGWADRSGKREQAIADASTKGGDAISSENSGIRESPEEVTNEFGDSIENKFGDMFGTPEQCIDEIQKETGDKSGGEVPAAATEAKGGWVDRAGTRHN